MIKLPGRKQPGAQSRAQSRAEAGAEAGAQAGAGAGQPRAGGPGGPGVAKLRKEVEALRRRVELLEQELQESRQLNKRLAEITDVVAEVLLPSDQRDEDRLRAALQRYDTAL